MKLEVKNIRKSFSGNEVLHGISFSVESGKALGLLGRNGAGKTTTIRILVDVFKCDSGEILMMVNLLYLKIIKLDIYQKKGGCILKRKLQNKSYTLLH